VRQLDRQWHLPSALGMAGEWSCVSRRCLSRTARGGLLAAATAVVANLTVTGSSGSGYVTAYPCGPVPTGL
jgi:hypothetical protein